MNRQWRKSASPKVSSSEKEPKLWKSLSKPFIIFRFCLPAALQPEVVGAAIVPSISAYANLHVYQTMKAKCAPNKVLMKRLFQAGRVGLVLAIGGAAVTFSAYVSKNRALDLCAARTDTELFL